MARRPDPTTLLVTGVEASTDVLARVATPLQDALTVCDDFLHLPCTAISAASSR